MNDLDAGIYENSGSQRVMHNGAPLHPWTLDPQNPTLAARRNVPNHVDNVEQIVFDNPNAGETYIIRVSAAPGESLVNELGNPSHQDVSLIISGNAPIQYEPFRILDIIPLCGDIYSLVWPSNVGGRYQVETSTDLTNWVPVAAETQSIGMIASSEISALEVDASINISEKHFYRVV